MLRPYQQAAVDAAISHMQKSLLPACIEAATGAGKSHIVSALAHWLNSSTGKKVLVLQPSKELTEQNREKYLALGEPCSLFSASAGAKCTKHDVVFGTPRTVLNSIERFSSGFALVIIDECHRIDPTTQAIISKMRESSPNLRVIGLTATPYRLQMGYIYQRDENGDDVLETHEPYFDRLLYRITAHELIEQGFLTRPTTTPTHVHYDTSGMQTNALGNYDQSTIVSQDTKTDLIIRDIASMSTDRAGVMVFAATVDHAKYISDRLANSAVITGETNKKDREQLIKLFKSFGIKYLINVSVLTTGFDAPHVDCVAILRATESPALLQQIIGRGLRLHDGKSDCLVLDYAENIERHCPNGDIFDPQIKQPRVTKGEPATIECPVCGYQNLFSLRQNDEGLDFNKFGYFLDLAGNVVETEHGPMPAHFGRRCNYVGATGNRCNYRWTTKECPDCGYDNDIAARKCQECKAILVDPNEKLRLEYKRIKSDPYELSTDKVLSWECKEHSSQAGNITLRIDYTTDYRSFSVWYMPRKQHVWADLCLAVFGRVAPSVELFVEHWKKGKMPETITVKRERGTRFYNVYGHNRPEDKQP